MSQVTMSQSITANVGSFGKVTGFAKGNVAEFRGIPFATVPVRFRRAEPLTTLPGGTLDATKYGPSPAQAPIDNEGEEYLFGEYVRTFFAEDSKRTLSERDCLNLNIVAPIDALGKKKLPVMVWIYGGAFAMGGNSKAFYNGCNLVEHSLKWNEPIIYVAVNYRVGFFGFLASKELAKDNASHGGGVGNYGIHDQRLALEWVQKNIQYFGGDPSQVTIFGESAGSASVHAHIVAGKPLFTSGIMQSGVLAECLGPMPLDNFRVQGDFDRLVERYGLQDKDDQGKVDGLRAVPMDELINAVAEMGPLQPFFPVDDSHLPGAFFDVGREETHGWLYHPNAPNFVKAVMAGDCEVEGIIFAIRMMPHNHAKVLERLQSSLPDSFLQKYGLAKSQTANITNIGQLIPLLVNFKTDELFNMSIYRFIREFSKTNSKVYEYHFDRGNPFNGAMKGVAHHALDLEYMFGNFLEGFAEENDRQLSEALMRYWIGFAQGKKPWADATSGKALHIGADASLTVVPREQVKSRRWDAYPEMEQHWEKVRQIGVQLMSGKM